MTRVPDPPPSGRPSPCTGRARRDGPRPARPARAQAPHRRGRQCPSHRPPTPGRGREKETDMPRIGLTTLGTANVAGADVASPCTVAIVDATRPARQPRIYDVPRAGGT